MSHKHVTCPWDLVLCEKGRIYDLSVFHGDKSTTNREKKRDGERKEGAKGSENMASNKTKMGGDEKQYNFIDDRNEEYFVDERVTGVTTGGRAVLRTKQRKKIWLHREK